MKQRWLRVLQGLVALLLVLYAVDWVALRLRAERGVSTVQVEQFLKTPLKGQKEEFDYIGTVDQPCVGSLFPHRSQSACWWLRIHKRQWISP